MQAVLHDSPLTLTAFELVSETLDRPHPQSYDSGAEFSLEHWMEVYRLVQEEFLLAEIAAGEGETWANDGWPV